MYNIWISNLRFVSDAGDKTFLVAFFAITSVVYLLSSGFKKEGLLLSATALSPLFSHILKLLFKQPRPSAAMPEMAFDKYGFPSSHTLSFTVFFGFLLYLSFKLTGLPISVRSVAVLLSIYFICLVGISRVALGYHFVWDVLAGYIFGILYLAVLIFLDRKL